MLINDQLLYPEVFIERDFPKNFQAKDLELFKLSQRGRSWEVRQKQFANLTINNEFFLKEHFRILVESFGDKSQSKVFNATPYLIKSFIKDRLRKHFYFDEVLWCFDTFSNNGYFHWITENLPRLWIASQQLDGTIPLPIPSCFSTNSKFANDLLKPFNRQLIPFQGTSLLKVKKLNLITQPGGPLNYQPLPIKKSTELLKQYYYDLSYKDTIEKIYISRRERGKRIVLNEDDVCSLIQPLGYKVLYLENLSIYDQVNLFCRAKEILSIHGAGLSNMVFMETGKVIEIRHNKVTEMLNFFFALSHTFEHEYYYCFGNDGTEIRKHEQRPQDISIHADLKMLKETLDAL